MRYLTLFLLLPGVLLAEPADLVLRNGSIYTVDADRSWAEAVAVRGNEIVYVGNDAGVDAFVAEETRVIDLEDRFVLPGFQDSHIHPISASLKTYMCNLYGLASVTAYLETIRGCVDRHSNAEWIHGAGWSHALFPDDAKPTHFMLDEIAPDIPLTLSSYDGHSLWANSVAMERAGINEKTRDVKGGKIMRFPDSRKPTGLFLESAAVLVKEAQPAYTPEDMYDALLEVQKYLNSLGVTSVQDALVALAEGGEYSSLPTYFGAAKANKLTLRVNAALYWEPDLGMEQVQNFVTARERLSTGKLNISSVKVWYDGVMHTRTSKLIEPYADRPREKGMSTISFRRLKQLAVALDAEGFQLHIHGDGDLAIRESLDAIELARGRNGPSDNRHHIAHLELIHPDDIPRFSELDVVANVQPMWSTYPPYISDLKENKIGPERARWLEINGSFLKHGVTVAYGSDWFVTTPVPVYLIEAAVTRVRPQFALEDKRNAEVLLPGEEVSVADAIASYTINGAFVNHQEETTGSIEVGKFADLVVLDQNLFEVEPFRISESQVLLTVMDGNIVHDDLTKE